jgi:hypothetical protein
MPVAVHKDVIHGRDAMAASIITVQAFIGVPVSRYIDGQALAGKIIEMQKRLVVLGKMTANQVNTAIDDQHLSAKLIAAENAANS